MFECVSLDCNGTFLVQWKYEKAGVSLLTVKRPVEYVTIRTDKMCPSVNIDK